MRVREQLGDGSLLHDLSGVEHDGPLAKLAHHAEVMGDEEQRHRSLPHQRAHQLQDLGLHSDVQSGRRLVRDEELGFPGEGHRDHDALTHATRELMGVPLGDADRLGQADRREEIQDAPLRRRAIQAEVEPQCLRDLLTGAVERVQGCQWILEDHRHPLAADPAETRLGQTDELLALEADAPRDSAGPWRQQAHDGAAAHALARAGLTDKADDLSGADGQVHAVDRIHVPGQGPEADLEPAHLQKVRSGTRRGIE